MLIATHELNKEIALEKSSTEVKLENSGKVLTSFRPLDHSLVVDKLQDCK